MAQNSFVSVMGEEEFVASPIGEEDFFGVHPKKVPLRQRPQILKIPLGLRRLAVSSSRSGVSRNARLEPGARERIRVGTFFGWTPKNSPFFQRPKKPKKSPDDRGASITHASLPAGMSINPTTGLVTWTPTDFGSFPVTVQVTDVLGQGMQQSFPIDVTLAPATEPPVITTQPVTSAIDGVAYIQPITAQDPQGEAITFSLTNYPDGMSIDPNTGLIQWLPAGVGSGTVTVVATDTSGLSATLNYTLTVHTNLPPTITSTPVTTITAGLTYAYDLTVDGNGDTVSYSLAPTSGVGAPAGMTIDSLGRITWKTDIADIGEHAVTVDVTSAGGLVTPQTYELDVVADTQAPTVMIETDPLQQVNLGESFTVLVAATDNVGVTALSLTANGTNVTLLPGTFGTSGTATLSFNTAGPVTLAATASDAAGNVGTANTTIFVVDPSVTEAPVATISSPSDGTNLTAPVPVIGTVSDPQNSLVSWSLTISPDSTGELPSSDPALTSDGPPTVIASGTAPITNGTLGTLDTTLLANGAYDLTLTATNAGGLTTTSTVSLTISGNLKLGALNLSFTDMTVQAAGIAITINRNYSSLNANAQGDFGYGWTLGLSNTKVQVIHQDNDLSDFGDYVPMEDGDRVIITLPDGTRDAFTFEAIPGETMLGMPVDYQPYFVPDAGTKDTILADEVSLQPVGNEWVNLETGDSYNPALPEFGGGYLLQLHNGTVLTIDGNTGDLVSIADRVGNTLTFNDDGIQSSSGPSVTFTRDAAGRITSITSSGGQTVSYQYDDQGNLVAFTDADSNTTQFTYYDDPIAPNPAAPAHYLQSIIAPNGVQAAAFDYYGGRVSSITEANGDTQNANYNVGTRSQTIYDASGYPTTTYYDTDGNPIEVVNAAGGVTLNTYDSTDDLLSTTEVTGEGDLTSTYTYDQYGDQISVTYPDGTTTSSTYNQFGQQLSQTDTLGNVTSYNYDQNGNLVSSTAPGRAITRYQYDSQGDPIEMTDPQGNVTTYSYNSAGNITNEISPRGVVASYGYDADGRVTSSSYNWVNPSNPLDVLAVTTSTAYDAAGNVISETDDNGHTTTTTYTPAGKVASTTAPNGDVTQNVYDIRGNVVESIQQSVDSSGSAVSLVTLSVYDADDRLIAQTDPFVEGTTAPITGTLTTYDALGDVIETQSVSGMVITLAGSGNEITSTLTSPGTVITSSASTYDDQGREISSTDQYGHQTITTYDTDGRVIDSRTQSVDQNGQTVWLVTQTVYNAQGQVELTTDQYQEGSSQFDATETIYDSLGRTVQTIRLQGVTVSLVNPNTGQPVDPTTDPGNVPVVSEVTNWGTQLYATKTVYNSVGQATESVAADGQVTQYEYNSLGQQTATIGQPVAPGSVGLGIPAGDPADTLVSLRTETAYDAYGNTSSQATNIYEFVLPDGSTQIDRSQEQLTQYEYDQFGNLVKTIYPDDSSMSAAYDSYGNRTSSTDQMGQTTQYQYDDENRLIGVILPAVTNPATNQRANPTYQYGYDANGNQTSLTDPNGGMTTFTYDAQGNELSRTLPLGQTESFQYDDQNRQTLAFSFEGNVTQSVYDPNTGNLAQTLLYPSIAAYDNGQGTPSETINYTYDAFGNQVEAQDTVGSGSSGVTSTTTTTYDSRANVLSVTSPQGTVSYTYDVYGRLASTMIGNASDPTSTTTYTYNQLGQLSEVQVTEQNGVNLSPYQTTSYEYDLEGKLIQQTDPNGVVDQYTYNNMNELTEETETGPGNAAIAEYLYSYRPDGLKATETDKLWFTNNDQPVEITNTISYTYDALDRLIDEAFVTDADTILGNDASLPSNVQRWESFTDEYTYDPDSNKVGQVLTEYNTAVTPAQTTTETMADTYDFNDRLQQEVDTTVIGTGGTPTTTTTDYTYDNTEQLSEAVTSGAPNSGGTVQSSQAYQYNLQGQMSGATVTAYANGTVSQVEQLTYGYDTDGNRVSALDQIGPTAGNWTSETLTEYLNDSNNQTGYTQVLRVTQSDLTTNQVQQVTEYAIGLGQINQTTTPYTGGQPGTPTTLQFGYDGSGSVRVLLNTAGAIATVGGVRQLFNYDAYGNAIGFNVAAAATTLLYNGQQTDAATGLQYLRARYYDTASGNFTSLDPYTGDSDSPISYNKYLYTQGDPVNRFDPSGEDASEYNWFTGMEAHFLFALYMMVPAMRAQTGVTIADMPLRVLFPDKFSYWGNGLLTPDAVGSTHFWELKPITVQGGPNAGWFTQQRQRAVGAQMRAYARALRPLGITRGDFDDVATDGELLGGIIGKDLTTVYSVTLYAPRFKRLQPTGVSTKGLVFYALKPVFHIDPKWVVAPGLGFLGAMAGSKIWANFKLNQVQIPQLLPNWGPQRPPAWVVGGGLALVLAVAAIELGLMPMIGLLLGL